jgi:hypothetical protein
VLVYVGSINSPKLVTAALAFGAMMIGISKWLRHRNDP